MSFRIEMDSVSVIKLHKHISATITAYEEDLETLSKKVSQ